MIEFILEALDAPKPGWPGRRAYIARALLRLVIEGLVFVALLLAVVALIVVVAAATDSLPPVVR